VTTPHAAGLERSTAVMEAGLGATPGLLGGDGGTGNGPATARLLFGALAAVISVLVVIPIANMLLQAAAGDRGTVAHLAETVLPHYVVTTLWLILGVGVGAPAIGTATAWLVTMYRFPGRRLFEWMLVLPLAMPAYVIAYAYTDLLQVTGPVQTTLRALTRTAPGVWWFPEVRSVGGAAAMLVLVLYPYVYLLARAAFLEQCVCVLEVSRTLGCTPWQSFRRVALPVARPAIVAGTVLALMETLADYGTVAFFGVQTFTTGIMRAWLSFGDPVAAARLSAILLAFVLAIVAVERLDRAPARFHHASGRYRHLPRPHLTGAAAVAAFAACALPAVFGFLLPAAVLVTMALEVDLPGRLDRYAELAGNSFLLGAVTAGLAVMAAVVLPYGARAMPGPVPRTANRVVGLGYAVPGTVMAVGVLASAAAVDTALDTWTRTTFGVSTGLVLGGSIAALVFAYLIRFLAVSLNAAEAGLAKIHTSIDAAAQVLGSGRMATLLRVHMPIMRASLYTAALLVFVDVVKELPATMMIRPFNFDTLAIQAYNYASDERLAEASIPSLAIVAVGMLPVILLSRTIARSRPGTARCDRP
jgi:iron(III) transport system permease protein